MYGWVILSAGFNTDKYSIEVEVAVFNWEWRVVNKPEKGLRLYQIGPLSFTLWNLEKSNEWLSNKISEVMEEEDVEPKDAKE